MHPDAYWFSQLIQTIRRLDDLMKYAGVEAEAVVLHNKGDKDRLDCKMTEGMIAAGYEFVKHNGTSKTSINGIQFIDRFEA